MNAKAIRTEMVKGSGNVFRDTQHPQADIWQAKAILAARIIRAMNDHGWNAREAERSTGLAHTDLSHIRNVRLDRFTIERLITILATLDKDIEVSVDIRPRRVPALEPS